MRINIALVLAIVLASAQGAQACVGIGAELCDDTLRNAEWHKLALFTGPVAKLTMFLVGFPLLLMTPFWVRRYLERAGTRKPDPKTIGRRAVITASRIERRQVPR